MLSRSRRAITGVTIAVLIIALATMGGYRLGSSRGAAPGRIRLAASTPQATTWISGMGSNGYNMDPSNCQRPTPCLDFNTAYADTVPGGEIDTVDAGPFGTLNIYHALTIDGGGGGSALIHATGDGIEVVAQPNDVVVLRHLHLHGSGGVSAGIRFSSGKELVLDDVTIEGYQTGISVQAPGPASVTITNSHIYNNSQVAVSVVPGGGTVQVSISHSQLARNYYGLMAQDGADVTLTDSVITGNTAIGAGCQTYGTGACTIQTESDRFDHNWAAVWMNHGAGNAQITMGLSGDAVFSDTYGIYGDFGGTLNAASFGNNRFMSNFVDGAASSSMTQK